MALSPVPLCRTTLFMRRCCCWTLAYRTLWRRPKLCYRTYRRWPSLLCDVEPGNFMFALCKDLGVPWDPSVVTRTTMATMTGCFTWYNVMRMSPSTTGQMMCRVRPTLFESVGGLRVVEGDIISDVHLLVNLVNVVMELILRGHRWGLEVVVGARRRDLH